MNRVGVEEERHVRLLRLGVGRRGPVTLKHGLNHDLLAEVVVRVTLIRKKKPNK